jgi:hypothetical protein
MNKLCCWLELVILVRMEKESEVRKVKYKFRTCWRIQFYNIYLLKNLLFVFILYIRSQICRFKKC